ncbi:hypothetical protein EGW08_007850 [Elysia chlorotica]|uniref:Endonuclease/exonuclease/phosphatase domain-containing protein n=1 Tax=Elysia chlorotica TaxID=188477 RepID=A0A433TS95_ELYCH|nr:hypothetical protein EGW08_007850 [Elysia chlorotica]
MFETPTATLYSTVPTSIPPCPCVSTRCKPVGSDYNNRFNGPGLVLLSKQEILSAKHQDFFPGKEQTIQRGFIEAEIKDLGTVVCSHFSSAFPYYFEYELSYDNYTQQQREEMAVIQEKFSSRDHIVMADFNTGPRVEGPMDSQTSLAGEAPQNYQLWLQAGYNNTYMEADGRCTFCTGNAIVDYPRVAIDFVLFKGDYTARQTQRTLDMSPPLSDHYGVRQTVCRN